MTQALVDLRLSKPLDLDLLPHQCNTALFESSLISKARCDMKLLKVYTHPWAHVGSTSAKAKGLWQLNFESKTVP